MVGLGDATVAQGAPPVFVAVNNNENEDEASSGNRVLIIRPLPEFLPLHEFLQQLDILIATRFQAIFGVGYESLFA